MEIFIRIQRWNSYPSDCREYLRQCKTLFNHLLIMKFLIFNIFQISQFSSRVKSLCYFMHEIILIYFEWFLRFSRFSTFPFHLIHYLIHLCSVKNLRNCVTWSSLLSKRFIFSTFSFIFITFGEFFFLSFLFFLHLTHDFSSNFWRNFPFFKFFNSFPLILFSL